MIKKLLFSALFTSTAFCAFAQSNNINSSPPTSPVPCQWTYNFVNNLATATYCGSAQSSNIALIGPAGSPRPLSWYTDQTQIWSLSIFGSNDNFFGLFAYNPTTGAYIGDPYNFRSDTKQINRTWYENDVLTASVMQSNLVVGRNSLYTNSSGVVGQGEKLGYQSNAGTIAPPTASVFDIASTRLMVNTATNFAATPFFTGIDADWVIDIGPTVGGRWVMTGEELDVVNRYQDNGFRPTRNASNGTNAFLAAAVASTFSYGGNTFNDDWGFAVSRSASLNQASAYDKWYVGYLCDQDSLVGSLGYCMYANGDTTSTPAETPYSPFGAGGTFLHGIDLSAATFTDNYGLRLNNTQGLAWLDNTNTVTASINLISVGQSIVLSTPTGNAVLGSSAVLTAAATGGFVSLPFVNNVPTGTPVYGQGGPSLVWNEASKTLDIYSHSAAAWYHITATTGAN